MDIVSLNSNLADPNAKLVPSLTAASALALAARIARLLMLAGFGVVLAFLAGFVWFAVTAGESEPSTETADGIVALTGGPARIEDALELLARGRGRWALITGVNPATSKGELTRMNPAHAQLFDCCVELDKLAINTHGNAVKTRDWVEARRLKSVIVVTSNWHMPRAMLELQRILPGVKLIPHAVTADPDRASRVPVQEPSFRIIASEYVKYLLAMAHVRLEDGVARDEMSARLPAARRDRIHPGA